jgi:predicted DNA-binding transcriptional regulator AlpA
MAHRAMRVSPGDKGRDLYVMQVETGYIKIGRSDDAVKRLSQIQAAQPIDVVLVHVGLSMGDTEASLLRILAGRRVRGEWLDGTMVTRDAIESHFERRLHWPFKTPLSKADTSPFSDEVLRAKDAAAFCGISLPSFWRAVSEERLPSPFYPSLRSPRWSKSDLAAALRQTQQLPRLAATSRRASAVRLIRAMRAVSVSGPEVKQ